MNGQRDAGQPGSRADVQHVAARSDQRGHGQSRPHPSEGARWNYDDLVRDAEVVAEFLCQRFPELPHIAVGHSLFGHVALAHQTAVITSPQLAWD